MGAAGSAEARQRERVGGGGGGGGAGGRDDGFGKEGNYWENEEDMGEHGLLEVTAQETSAVAAKMMEIRDRSADVDKSWRLITIKADHPTDESGISKRMAELRHNHQEELIKKETEKQRKCVQCNKTIENELSKYVGHDMYVHNGCHEDYKISIAPECAHCHEKVVKVGGKFSGNKVKAQDGSEVHVECQEEYLLAMGEPCAQCEERLAGEYVFAVDGNKVHCDCKELYDRDKGLVCIQCRIPFNGAGPDATEEQKRAMQRVNFGEHGCCHPGACSISWVREKAEKCVHCHRPIMPRIGGAVAAEDKDGDGVADPAAADNFIELENELGKVHLKCHEEYRGANLMTCGVCQQPLKKGAIYSVFGEVPAVTIHAECQDRWLEEHGSAEFRLLRR